MKNKIKSLQKCLLIASIVSVSITVLLLISAIFIDNFFDKFILRNILLTCALIAAGSFFSNSALDVYGKTKKLALVSLGLVLFACVLGLLEFWTDFKLGNTMGKVIGIVAISSCFFTMIITTNAKLSGHYTGLRVIYFSLICLIDISLILQILGVAFGKDEYDEVIHVFGIKGFGTIFAIVCLAVFAMMCVCNILSKKLRMDQTDEQFEENAKQAMSLQNDNESLKKQIEELKQENEALKKQIEELKAKL